MNLRGKSVLITGARRVGGELALLLAARGADVGLTYMTSREAIERTAAAVEARGTRSLAVAADLSDAAQAEAAVDRVVERFGRLDVLINMASIYRPTPLATLAPGDFDAMIAANLAAPYHTSVAAARRMVDRPADPGEGLLQGKIITVGDWATDRPYPGYLPYIVAKGGLTAMTLALAAELAPRVAVNLVQPAMIEPPPDLSPAEVSAVVDATPLRRRGTPDDLSNLILYLLEGTDFATGACFRVDGGRFIAPGPE
ncbi:SDR family NAD(P)-dependent oxidoreductase [Tundrisphaera sp. TA3]|uniref:SDR family NAD(P)-dependent oxidoreductase n=1 Tax=Tundrisphaera sp. TA3 TaxID=3435775 RepID=UPI003EBC214F